MAAHFLKGIGTLLFGEAMSFAREHDAVRMKLFGVPNALGFYERLGMRKTGDEPSQNENPYWTRRSALTIKDPEGNAVVIVPGGWRD